MSGSADCVALKAFLVDPARPTGCHRTVLLDASGAVTHLVLGQTEGEAVYTP